MKTETKIINDVIVETIINDDGTKTTKFNPIKIQKDDIKKESFGDKVKSFLDRHNFGFYFRTRDLNNSKEEPYLNKPKTSCEVGIKISF